MLSQASATDEIVRKHAARMEAKEAARVAKEAARAPKPDDKYTKKMVSTKQKRAEFKAMDVEAAEEEEEVRLVLRREDGATVGFVAALEDIRAFLKAHGAEATLDEVRRAVGIDLLQPGLLDALRVNPQIEVVAQAAGECVRYRPPYGARNRGSLAHALSRACPNTDGEPEAVLRSELKAGATYAGVDVDVDELLAQGRCVRVFQSDATASVSVRRSADFALFAAVPGRAATDEVRAMWRAQRLPEKKELQQQLVARKLRTAEEMAARQERKAAARQRAAEAANGPKRARTGSIRTWTNTHLGNTEELEGMFARK